jgi:sulfite oxidase
MAALLLRALSRRRAGWAAASAAAAATAAAAASRGGSAQSDAAAAPATEPGVRRPGLPEFSADEVRACDGAGGARVLVTYGDGVYDVTEFVKVHPGGRHIMLAAGGAVEPFWALYAQHREEYVYELLEEMRVGNLKDGARVAGGGKAVVQGDVYGAEPERHPALLVRSERPYTAEPPAGLLVATQLTPNALFYKRNHLPVPDVDAEAFRLEVCGVDGEVVRQYGLEELKGGTFKEYSVDATLQCAGNRRDEMSAVKAVKGGRWDFMATSNARWTGVRLRDVVADAGLDLGGIGEEGSGGARHVVFDGLDADPLTKKSYGASVPIDVVQRVPDVLLAYEMNGETLPRDHGYPLRAIVPGIVGARQVKWLGRVSLSRTESDCHWQQKDYKGFCPSVDWDTVDFESSPAIQELPVVSAICAHEVREGGIVEVKGYAWSGDGKGIIRVDVSGDGGETWQAAELLPKGDEEGEGGDEKRRSRVYDWTRWAATVKTRADGKEAVLVCKAVDSSYQTQPERVESIWNLRGVLNNSWHRVSVVDGGAPDKERSTT